jgi:hypothetical protein
MRAHESTLPVAMTHRSPTLLASFLEVTSDVSTFSSASCAVFGAQPEANDEKTGWNAMHVIASLCDSSTCRAGDPSSQFVASCFGLDPAVGII